MFQHCKPWPGSPRQSSNSLLWRKLLRVLVLFLVKLLPLLFRFLRHLSRLLLLPPNQPVSKPTRVGRLQLSALLSTPN